MPRFKQLFHTLRQSLLILMILSLSACIGAKQDGAEEAGPEGADIVADAIENVTQLEGTTGESDGLPVVISDFSASTFSCMPSEEGSDKRNEVYEGGTCVLTWSVGPTVPERIEIIKGVDDTLLEAREGDEAKQGTYEITPSATNLYSLVIYEQATGIPSDRKDITVTVLPPPDYPLNVSLSPATQTLGVMEEISEVTINWEVSDEEADEFYEAIILKVGDETLTYSEMAGTHSFTPEVGETHVVAWAEDVEGKKHHEQPFTVSVTRRTPSAQLSAAWQWQPDGLYKVDYNIANARKAYFISNATWHSTSDPLGAPVPPPQLGYSVPLVLNPQTVTFGFEALEGIDSETVAALNTHFAGTPALQVYVHGIDEGAGDPVPPPQDNFVPLSLTDGEAEGGLYGAMGVFGLDHRFALVALGEEEADTTLATASFSVQPPQCQGFNVFFEDEYVSVIGDVLNVQSADDVQITVSGLTLQAGSGTVSYDNLQARANVNARYDYSGPSSSVSVTASAYGHTVNCLEPQSHEMEFPNIRVKADVNIGTSGNMDPELTFEYRIEGGGGMSAYEAIEIRAASVDNQNCTIEHEEGSRFFHVQNYGFSCNEFELHVRQIGGEFRAVPIRAVVGEAAVFPNVVMNEQGGRHHVEWLHDNPGCTTGCGSRVMYLRPLPRVEMVRVDSNCHYHDEGLFGKCDVTDMWVEYELTLYYAQTISCTNSYTSDGGFSSSNEDANYILNSSNIRYNKGVFKIHWDGEKDTVENTTTCTVTGVHDTSDTASITWICDDGNDNKC